MAESLFSWTGGIDPDVVEAAREELRNRLPELRTMPGFPIGSDEDILKMSVPPYYTACPNPFIEKWLKETKPDGYDDREYVDPGPFVHEVSEGKTHLFYRAHAYPTKVPHQAIMRFILHYTSPGDVVVDGFAGTGMTGVAAQACQGPDPETRAGIEAQIPEAEWGVRRAIVADLLPAASSIAAGLNLPVDAREFEEASARLLASFDEKLGWMYQTRHADGSVVPFSYVVWSEVFTCPNCGEMVVFYDTAFDSASGKVKDDFSCGSCSKLLSKGDLDRVMSPSIAPGGQHIERVRYDPAIINYRVGRTQHEKRPDEEDRSVLERIRLLAGEARVPDIDFPIDEMYHGSRLAPKGFTNIRSMYTDRALVALSWLWEHARQITDPLERMAMCFWLDQAIPGLSMQNGYEPIQFGRKGGSQVNRYKKGFYYVPSLHAECSVRYNLLGSMPSRGKRANLIKMWANSPATASQVMISTGSSAALTLPDSSVDYVFVDPPFGSNFYYVDLAFQFEAWYGVFGDRADEAIVNTGAGYQKPLDAYTNLMASCFGEFFRVLKPGRWMTVEFSNSSNDVWLAIQEALSLAGFVTADTRVFDKQQGSFRQTTATNVVKRDLIISAYKPSTETEQRFGLVAGSPEGAWEFVREHLSHLPVSEGKRSEARAVRERMADRLYDRMVAYHVHRSVTVPLTAGEFYAGLEQRFPVRDDMYFLPEQVEAYERHRMTVKELVQAELFITNEQSAVQWLRQFLKRRPSTYAEIQPAFFSELQAGLPEWEALPELRDLLEGSFLQDEQGRWYLPDPKKTEDLEKLRTRALLKEFDAYRDGKGKLDRFRSEAVRAGFKEAWARRDFATIITVGKRLPPDAFVEDEALLYYHDNARRLANS